MDLGEQEVIKQAVEANGKEGMVVILGSPSPESAELFAETVVHGDPTWAGPLAGVPLGLPVFHMLEDAVRDAVPAAVYEEQVSIMETVLDKSRLAECVRRVREES